MLPDQRRKHTWQRISAPMAPSFIIRAEAAPFQIIVENKDPTILWANVDGAEGRRIDLSNQPTEHAWIAISCIVLCTHHGNSRLLNDRWEAGTHTE